MEFVGQEGILKVIRIHLAASKARGELPRHMLFSGPPGLGKTELAKRVAKESGLRFKFSNGRNFTSYTKTVNWFEEILEPTIAFIDEIHGMNIQSLEGMYHLMQEGVFVESLQFVDESFYEELRIPVTIIGATTDAGQLSKPLRDRFSYFLRFKSYSHEELIKIAAQILPDAPAKYLDEIAKRSFGNARVAVQTARQVLDFLESGYSEISTIFEILGLDAWGLNDDDRAVVEALTNGGVMSLDTLSAVTKLSKDTLFDDIEPRLIDKGLLERTPRGRKINTVALAKYLTETSNAP
jgi:holliday junction DNA helicase RuvB